MLSSDARVQRSGKHETIPTRDLVPGDIVILRAGDRVPADMRLIESHNLRVEEAILTGESTVVDKTTDALEGELPLGDRTNMLFSGTTISAGGGVGVVTATGQETELYHINQMMAGIEKHRTPLLVQMDKLGKAIFVIILAMMVALFVFSLALRDIPLGELLLSLISLAVTRRAGRLTGDYLDYSLSGRTGDGAPAGDYPQAANGGNPGRHDRGVLG
ncbi:hypothetical protein QYS46_09715 [Klebsiella michiganensis]|nr:hypothetical protein [Klebsiella michiganensis]